MFNCKPCNNVHNMQNGQSDFDNLQKARLDLIGEIQAIYDYDQHLYTSNDPVARETWRNIKEEELTHVGELLGLIEYLDPSQRQFVEQGYKEFNDRFNNTQRRIRD